MNTIQKSLFTLLALLVAFPLSGFAQPVDLPETSRVGPQAVATFDNGDGFPEQGGYGVFMEVFNEGQRLGVNSAMDIAPLNYAAGIDRFNLSLGPSYRFDNQTSIGVFGGIKDIDFEGEDRLLSQVGFRLTEDNPNDPVYVSLMVRTPFSVTNDSVGPFDVVDVGASVGVSF